MNFNRERRNLIKEYRILKKRGETRNFLPSSEKGVVHIPLKGDEESLFTSYNPEIPSSEALEYLRECAKALLPSQLAEIVLEGECDLRKVEEKYKDYLAYSINRTEKEKKLFSFLALGFLLAGAGVVLGSYFFGKFGRALVAETIDTVGCFFIWTASEFWFIRRRVYYKSQLDDLRLYATPWSKKDGSN